jgi:hypothetical protein
VTVDERGKAIILGCEVGKPYASEVNMLRKILETLEDLPRIPFIVDKGYDAVCKVDKYL